MKKSIDFCGQGWYYNPRAADTAVGQLQESCETKKFRKKLEKSC